MEGPHTPPLLHGFTPSARQEAKVAPWIAYPLASLEVDDASIQIEASVETSCPSEAAPTASLALDVGQPSRLVRVMALDHALAHKLAAWSERRLLRDLYDVYFLVVRQGVRPDMATLESRLGRIQSRLPQLKKRRSMTVEHLRSELLEAYVSGRGTPDLRPRRNRSGQISLTGPGAQPAFQRPSPKA